MSGEVEFRGLAIDDYLGIRLDIVRGFLAPPDVRGTDYVVAARAGRSVGNRVADVLEIVLEGYVAGTNAADWRAKTDLLLGVLDESAEALPGLLVVRGPQFGLATGTEASITARVKNAVEGPVRFGFAYQAWSVALESVDPAWVVEGS